MLRMLQARWSTPRCGAYSARARLRGHSCRRSGGMARRRSMETGGEIGYTINCSHADLIAVPIAPLSSVVPLQLDYVFSMVFRRAWVRVRRELCYTGAHRMGKEPPARTQTEWSLSIEATRVRQRFLRTAVFECKCHIAPKLVERCRLSDSSNECLNIAATVTDQ